MSENGNGNGSGHFEFDNFRLDHGSRVLWRGGAEVHLAKRPFQVLEYLIENRERVVSRNELLDRFWEGHEVYDDALRKCVGAIRQALDDNGRPAHYIETRYGSGYRFVGEAKNGKAPTLNGEHIAAVTVVESPAGFSAGFSGRRAFAAVLAVVLPGIVLAGLYLAMPGGGTGSNDVADTPSRIRSIAVSPLKNLTGDAGNDYFSDGVTESMISDLSRIAGLKTVSRSSTFALKERDADPRDVGKKLGVDALLEGSLQRRGEMFSVNVRMISTADGRVLWTSPDLERAEANAFELQNEISRSIAIALEAKLNDSPAGESTKEPKAYEAYLRGRYHFNTRTGDGIKRSIDYFQEAIRLDNNYAPAYAGLAESYVQGIWHVPFDPKAVLPKARVAAERAIAIDGSLAEAYVALANVSSLEWKWADAEAGLQKAIDLNPGYARAFHSQAFIFLLTGRNDDAIAAIERARELDPLNLVINTDKAMIFFAAGRDDEAFSQWDTTLELDPNFVLAHEHRAMAFGVVGNNSAAIDEQAKVLELRAEPFDKVAAFRVLAARVGMLGIYRKEIRETLAKEARGQSVSSVHLAACYAVVGQKEEAFKRLEKAVSEHTAEIVIAKTSRQFDPLRSDPRFAALLERAGLPG